MKVEPRWLDARSTADYVCVRPNMLSRLVKAGRFPAPAHYLGLRQPRWDRLAIDAFFQQVTAPSDVDALAETIAHNIREGR